MPFYISALLVVGLTSQLFTGTELTQKQQIEQWALVLTDIKLSDVSYFLLDAWISSLALALVQFAANIAFNAMLAFTGTMLYIILSGIYLSPLLIGNTSQFLRFCEGVRRG